MLKRIIKKGIAKYAAIKIEANYLQEDTLFAGKVVAITGGTGDIAGAAMERFRRSGARCILIGRNKAALQRLQSEQVKTVVWDITDLSIREEKIREAASCFGRIDIWVNNAGVISENDLMGDFWHAGETDWDTQMAVNAKALYFITQAVCRYFISENICGHIVQVLSINGIITTWQPYGQSKCLAINLTKGIAKEAARYGIIVNGVAPGGVATKMIEKKLTGEGKNLRNNYAPTRRYSTPEEVANAIWLLASDMAAQRIGDVVVLDGGVTL